MNRHIAVAEELMINKLNLRSFRLQERFFQIVRSGHVLRTLSTILHFVLLISLLPRKTHSDNLYS